MAKNKVYIDVVVDDKGTTKRVAVNAKKLGLALEDTGKSARTADRNLKGAAQASANGTKNFSKMAQGISGGLVPAYATLAANVFAVTAAFNFFKGAADFRVIEESQLRFAEKTGKSLSLLTSRIQDATDGVLTFQDAAQATAIGTASGLSSDQLSDLASVAKNASLALGRDLSDSFDRLVRGATKAEPELLDELGIILRLETATTKYAEALGKNAKDLTAYQRTQAVVNEVLEQGNEKFSDLGGNVNQIAKLGKAFDDLLKKIKGFISPIAEFIAGALSKNVIALTGAFTLLGQSIIRSLVPAAPKLSNIAEEASNARKELQAAAGTSAIGQKLGADPSQLNDAELKWVENSAKTKTSTIINYDNITKEAVTRNVRIIRAEQQLALAQQTTGIKKYYATWRAELALLQATHGQVMGFLKASTLAFTRFASAALGIAGLVGLALSLIGILKQAIDYFKDPALLRLLDRLDGINDSLREQQHEVERLVSNAGGFKTVGEEVEYFANAINNLGFREIKELNFQLGELKKRQETANDLTQGVAGQNRKVTRGYIENSQALEAQVGTLRIFIDNLGTLSSSLKKAGQPTKQLDDNIGNLEGSLSAALAAQKAYRKEPTAENNEAVRASFAALQQAVRGVPEATKEATFALNDQKAAFLDILQVGDEFKQFQQGLAQNQSVFSRSISITKRSIEDILGTGRGMSENLVDVFDDKQLAVFADQLKGITVERLKQLTLEDLIRKLGEKAQATLDRENSVLLQKTKTQILAEKVLRNTTPLQRENLQIEINRLQKVNEIRELNATINQQLADGATLDSSGVKANTEKLRLLQAQLETIHEQTDAMLELSNSAKGAFEGATQSGIADLIKGNESSLKDAMLKIAQATVSAIADTLAKQVTEGITGFLFGTPEDKIRKAHSDGADIAYERVKQGHIDGLAAGTTTSPGISSSSIDAMINDIASGGGVSSRSIDSMINDIAAMKGEVTTSSNVDKPGPFSTLFGNLIGKKAGRDDSAARRSDPTSMPTTGEGVLEEVVTSSEGGATGLTRLFTSFTDNMKSLFDEDTPFLTGLTNLFGDLGSDLGSIFSSLTKDLGGLFSSLPDLLGSILGGLGGGGGLFTTLLGFFGFANGGIARGGFRSAAYANGGIARRPTLGLVGEGKYDEAIVPLPDGKSIPVSMGKGAGMGQQNNVTVNVTVDSEGNGAQSSQSDSQTGASLGKVIALAVQQELINQKRAGGILSPHGAS